MSRRRSRSSRAAAAREGAHEDAALLRRQHPAAGADGGGALPRSGAGRARLPGVRQAPRVREPDAALHRRSRSGGATAHAARQVRIACAMRQSPPYGAADQPRPRPRRPSAAPVVGRSGAALRRGPAGPSGQPGAPSAAARRARAHWTFQPWSRFCRRTRSRRWRLRSPSAAFWRSPVSSSTSRSSARRIAWSSLSAARMKSSLRDLGEEFLDDLEQLAPRAIRGLAGRMVRCKVEGAGLRSAREEELRSLAERAAEEAVACGEAVLLEPLSSADRRIVHLALVDDPRVTTREPGLRRREAHPGLPRRRRRNRAEAAPAGASAGRRAPADVSRGTSAACRRPPCPCAAKAETPQSPEMTELQALTESEFSRRLARFWPQELSADLVAEALRALRRAAPLGRHDRAHRARSGRRALRASLRRIAARRCPGCRGASQPGRRALGCSTSAPAQASRAGFWPPHVRTSR